MSGREVTEADFDALFGGGSSGFEVSEATVGADVSEDAFDALFSHKSEPVAASEWRRDVADFRRVGLQPEVAEKAVRSLRRGTYGSFEEAAVMSATNIGSNNKASRVQLGILETVKAERLAAGIVEEKI